VGFRAWGLGLGSGALGRAPVPKFRVQGSGLRIEGLGFRVWGLWFRVWGLGFGVWGLGSFSGPQSLNQFLLNDLA